jgi:hypothetical protein
LHKSPVRSLVGHSSLPIEAAIASGGGTAKAHLNKGIMQASP